MNSGDLRKQAPRFARATVSTSTSELTRHGISNMAFRLIFHRTTGIADGGSRMTSRDLTIPMLRRSCRLPATQADSRMSREVLGNIRRKVRGGQARDAES